MSRWQEEAIHSVPEEEAHGSLPMLRAPLKVLAPELRALGTQRTRKQEDLSRPPKRPAAPQPTRPTR